MTNILLLIFFLPLELLTLRWAIRRSGFIPFPHGIMAYLILGQIILALHNYGYLSYGLLRVYTTYAYIHFFSQMFLLLATMFFTLCLIVPKTNTSVIDALRQERIDERLFWVLVAALYGTWFITILSANLAVLWSNNTYLSMTTPDTALVTNNALTRLAIQLTGPLGLLGAVAMAFSWYSGRRAIALALTPIILWSLLFALSAHSRAAALYLVFGGMMAIFARARFAAAILVLAGFVAMLSVLGGRGSGHHGFSSLPEFFRNIAIYYRFSGLDVISNVFEGMFQTSEYFSHNWHFDPIFKRLSLSPLFSFIDGYDSVKQLYSIPLFYFVPNPAVSEVLSFGPGYATIYFGTILLCGYLSAQLVVRQPGLISLALNTFVLLGGYLQFTYDTRSSYRTFFYMAIICFVLLRRQVDRNGSPAHA
jgi:hypothetical protein